MLGNLDPALHAHVVPRYMNEPAEFRQGPPWSYDRGIRNSVPFDAARDRELMSGLAQAIQRRL